MEPDDAAELLLAIWTIMMGAMLLAAAFALVCWLYKIVF